MTRKRNDNSERHFGPGAPATGLSYHLFRGAVDSALRSRGELPGEAHQPLESVAGRAGIDRAGRQLHAFLQIASAGAHDERRGGVHEHDVALRPQLAPKNRADDLGVLLAIATEEIADGDAGESEVLRPDDER